MTHDTVNSAATWLWRSSSSTNRAHREGSTYWHFVDIRHSKKSDLSIPYRKSTRKLIVEDFSSSQPEHIDKGRVQELILCKYGILKSQLYCMYIVNLVTSDFWEFFPSQSEYFVENLFLHKTSTSTRVYAPVKCSVVCLLCVTPPPRNTKYALRWWAVIAPLAAPANTWVGSVA